MHKITKTYTRLSRLMLATAFTLTSLTAAAQTDNMEAYTRDSTMNALDYTLQRPLPSRQFEKKRFGDRRQSWLPRCHQRGRLDYPCSRMASERRRRPTLGSR